MPLYIHTNYCVPILTARLSTGVWTSAPAEAAQSMAGVVIKLQYTSRQRLPSHFHTSCGIKETYQCHRSFSPLLHVFAISEYPLDQRLLFDPRKRLTVLAVLRQLLQMAYLGMHYKSDQATDPFFFFFFIKTYLIFQCVFFFLKHFFKPAAAASSISSSHSLN